MRKKVSQRKNFHVGESHMARERMGTLPYCGRGNGRQKLGSGLDYDFIRILTRQNTLMGKVKRTRLTLTQRGRREPMLFYFDRPRVDVQRLGCRNSDELELFDVRKVALLRRQRTRTRLIISAGFACVNHVNLCREREQRRDIRTVSLL